MGRYVVNVENKSFPYSMSMRKRKSRYEGHISDVRIELFVVEQVGAVNHNRKGQFFVPLSFEHELGNTILDCQLDTGTTYLQSDETGMCVQSYIPKSHPCNQKPHS